MVSVLEKVEIKKSWFQRRLDKFEKAKSMTKREYIVAFILLPILWPIAIPYGLFMEVMLWKRRREEEES